MAINPNDIVSTLQAMGMIKYWKGKHIILKKQDVIEDYQERSKRHSPAFKELDSKCLRWTPFVPPSAPNAAGGGSGGGSGGGPSGGHGAGGPA
ncbi:hypothetical protein ONE63_008757 [Megalurothrips usitatus]|uniref:Histone acetyltransferase n=1 Tax=Megalurothrips usitatus TaxID=439358 RepID=A0AAV7XM68_9NEOP|nr:hypothetical protein ONE63_008757 [Megalurothrips usitatus]